MDIYDLLDRFFRSTLNSDFLNTAAAHSAAGVFESAEREGLTAENITERLNSDSDLSLSRFTNAAPVNDRITEKLAQEPREMISALMISPQSEAVNSKENGNMQTTEAARGYDLPEGEFYRESDAAVNTANQAAASFQTVPPEDAAAVLTQRERYGSYTQTFVSDNKPPDTADRALTPEREILRSTSEFPQSRLTSERLLSQLDRQGERVRVYPLAEGASPVLAAKGGLEGEALGGDILREARFQMPVAPSSANIRNFVLTEAGQRLKDPPSPFDLGKTVLIPSQYGSGETIYPSLPSDRGETICPPLPSVLEKTICIPSLSAHGETDYPPPTSDPGKSVYPQYADSPALSGARGGEWEKNTAPAALRALDQNVILNHVPNVISKAEEAGYIKAENGNIKDTVTAAAKNGGLLQTLIPDQIGAELFYTQSDPSRLKFSHDALAGVKQEAFKTADTAKALNAVHSPEAVSAYEAELTPFSRSVQADALTSAPLPALSRSSPNDISQKEISEIRAASAGEGSTAYNNPEINIDMSCMSNTVTGKTDINEVISSITDAVIEASRVVSERAGDTNPF